MSDSDRGNPDLVAVDEGAYDMAARLIEARRKATRPRLSIREAARRADMSDTRWRQITAGEVRIGASTVVVRGPAETLARMAEVVGVSPEELERAGRVDAASAARALKVMPPDLTQAIEAKRREIEEGPWSEAVKTVFRAGLEIAEAEAKGTTG